ncbi:MAG TPA: metal-dependent transcriptional regulator [Solirubrobacteraceae bacterium]|nr:metal-dependent transcriptional regulator [Solirubrobacteraceae bacterium]
MIPEERVPSVVEDYAKALYSLETRTQGAPVRTSALADRLGLNPPQVSLMCKRLAEMGLVTRSAYHGVQLTDDGRRVALQVLRHHRLLELFLADQLGLPWDRVHEEAEVLEHWVSDQVEAAIAEKLGHPTVDPHGDPIPTADLVIDEGQTVSLDALRAGEAGTFVRVSDSDPGMLRFLADRGVVPGERLEVVDKQPFDGPVFLRRADDAGDLVLGVQLARAMRIELDPAAEDQTGSPA